MSSGNESSNTGETPTPMWSPAPDADQSTIMGRYKNWVAVKYGLNLVDYEALWRWSTEDLEGFWASIWEFFNIRASHPYDAVLANDAMPGAVWFPGALLNYAENALATTGGEVAVIARSQSRSERQLTWDELRDLVGRCRSGLARLGVERGDRVVAYLPNGVEALVAFLATASLGAVWASCPPEFGTRSVVDRFGQLDPKVFLFTQGYRYGTKQIDRTAEVAEIKEALPTVAATVNVDSEWDELVSGPADLSFEPVPFDHPLYVLFSSGTTGPPKAIVHGHGGILLEHVKALGLHQDLGPGDRFFWFSTTGWMMWNLLVSGLCVGSTIVLFDGDPGWPDLGALWTMAAEVGVTVFGTSAPFIMACRSADLELAAAGDLSAVRSVGSTGAPLPVQGYNWIGEQIPGVWLTSISGGTDVCTAFVGGSPLVPVVPGEISCRYLGAAVAAFDDEGHEVVGAEGELVITRPMPSMPVGFWGDDDGSRYQAAYFEGFPGVWSHGDSVTITDRGSLVISGRSDATLNRGGVRLGTSEFYTVVEAVEGVADSLVVHLEDPDGGSGLLVLFVELSGIEMDAELRSSLNGALRSALSPRHVPDRIIAVPKIPRTHSGKKLEVPIKRILQGSDPARVVSADSLADPSALDVFINLDLKTT